MGSVGNPNPWATYDNFKDCSQAICSIYCPQFCYLIFPPPPPSDDDSGSSFSPLIIAVIGVLATGLLLVSYYIILSRYCKRRDDHSIVVGPDEIRGEAGNDPGQVPPNGLDESLIKNITVFKYQKSDGSVEVSDCAVCLSEFQENESLRLLPKCSHAFHLPCIDTWLKSHSNCPLCRTGVVVVAPPEASADRFEVHRPDDLTLVVDDQECYEPVVVVSLQNEQELRDVVHRGAEGESRRSISLGTFSCRRHLLISDVLKIEEDLEFGSGEHCKSIGSSNGFGSNTVDSKRSISPGVTCVHS
ncbi:RING/U-box superfamily protein [Dorcoceras hygrometricum]|uniref:RING-type E3 ubiquitin transferase n=1 Tax=Dorcoceras hygrometricum TaxID=472368 RepID=A0A2Z7CS73_9LAMI|nr:RING/U-box superfamily protein [Dorcoceras hygrometricum]